MKLQYSCLVNDKITLSISIFPHFNNMIYSKIPVFSRSMLIFQISIDQHNYDDKDQVLKNVTVYICVQ